MFGGKLAIFRKSCAERLVERNFSFLCEISCAAIKKFNTLPGVSVASSEPETHLRRATLKDRLAKRGQVPKRAGSSSGISISSFGNVNRSEGGK